MNWGRGIAFVYLLFAGGMVFMVVRSTKHKPDMVRKDYYQLDLDYQDHLEKKQRAAALETPLKIAVNRPTGSIDFQFPKSNATGNLKLYRFNSESDAFEKPISVSEGALMQIPIAEMAKGRWKIEADWQAEGLTYYQEYEVYL